MATPILGLTNCCFGSLEPLRKNEINSTTQILWASIALDASVSITAFVYGILGATAAITMPAAAAYALIATSLGITVLWGALAIKVFWGDTNSWET